MMSTAPETPEGADPALHVVPTGPTLPDDPSGLLGASALRPVSAKLIPARYVAASIGYVFCLLLLAGAIVAAVLTGWWWLGLTGLIPQIGRAHV